METNRSEKRVLVFALICAALIVLNACGKSGAGSAADSELKNLPGEDSSAPILLGQGYNSVTADPLGHCVALGSLKTQSGQNTGAFAEYRTLEITSETQLRENLNISASGSVKYSFFGGGSARMEFARSVNKNSSSKFLLIHARVGNQLELAESFKLKEDAKKLLSLKKFDMFAENCGNEFVFGRRTGGEFYAVFEYEFSSSSEEEKFSAAIKASGTGWKASGDINRELSKFNMNAKVHVKMIRFGGHGDLPDVGDLVDYARKFPSLVDAVSGAPVTLELITKNYKGVEPFDVSNEAPILRAQNMFINVLAERYEGALERLSTVSHIKNNPELYKAFNVNELNEHEQALNEYVNVLKSAAQKCYDKSINEESCKMPTDPSPYLQLPKYRYPTELCEDLRMTAFRVGLADEKRLEEWREKGQAPVFKDELHPENGLVAIWYCDREVNK